MRFVSGDKDFYEFAEINNNRTKVARKQMGNNGIRSVRALVSKQDCLLGNS